MMHLLFAILLLLAGCGNESVNEAKPSPGGVSYSSSPEIDPFVDSSGSPEPVASSSSEVVIEKSSSSLQVSSSAEESSSSEDTEWSSSSMSQGCTGPACYLYSSSSSSSSSIKVVYGEMTDERDGQTYKTVKVNDNVTWMAENLNYAYLQPTAELDSSSWCQNDDPENCEKDRRLYIWSAAMDSAALFSEDGKDCGYGVRCGYPEPDTANFFWYWVVRGVCPEGWHLPNDDEWSDFVSAALGGYRSALLKSNTLLSSYEEKELFVNLDSLFIGPRRTSVYYWTSQEYYYDYARMVEFQDLGIMSGEILKSQRSRVRCVQDYERENW